MKRLRSFEDLLVKNIFMALRKIKGEDFGELMREDDDRVIFPHFGIEMKHLPEARQWEIGEKYYVLLEVRMKDKSTHETEEEKSGFAGFDVTAIGPAKKPKGDFRELPEREE